MNFETVSAAMMATPDGSGEVSFPWGDATFAFRLDFKQIKKLEAKCDIGLQKMCALMCDGSLRLQHMEDILRHGLLGAGMEIEKVEGAIRRNFYDQPLGAITNAAWAVGWHALGGPVLDRPQGKAGRGGQQTTAGASPSPTTSEQPAQSV